MADIVDRDAEAAGIDEWESRRCRLRWGAQTKARNEGRKYGKGRKAKMQYRG